MRGILRCLALLALVPCAQASVLSVDEIIGSVALSRADAGATLGSEDALLEGDVLKTGAGSRLDVNFVRHGFLQLGAGTELVLERVPDSSFSEDLRTSLRLVSGTLRLVWKHAAETTSWPLFVYFGDQRASLRSGEYFFAAGDGRTSALCVASGEAVVGSHAATRPQLLAGPACYRLQAGTAAEKLARPESDFIEARAALDITALLEMPAPAKAARLEPAKAADMAAVKTQTAADSARGWIVNVASSTDRAGAEKDAQRLRAAGLSAAVNAAELNDVNGHLWYRVQLEAVASRAEARTLAERMKNEFGFRESWLQRSRAE